MTRHLLKGRTPGREPLDRFSEGVILVSGLAFVLSLIVLFAHAALFELGKDILDLGPGNERHLARRPAVIRSPAAAAAGPVAGEAARAAVEGGVAADADEEN